MIRYMVILLVIGAMNNGVYASFFDRVQAFFLAQNGEWDKVQSLLDKNIIDNPADMSLLYDAGVAAYSLNHFDQAALYFDHVSGQKTVDMSLKEKALFNRGCVAYKKQQLAEAITFFQQVLAINPDNTKAQENIKHIQEMMKKKQHDDKRNNDNQHSGGQNNQDQDNGQDKQKNNDVNDNQQSKKDEQRSEGPDDKDRLNSSSQDNDDGGRESSSGKNGDSEKNQQKNDQRNQQGKGEQQSDGDKDTAEDNADTQKSNNKKRSEQGKQQDNQAGNDQSHKAEQKNEHKKDLSGKDKGSEAASLNKSMKNEGKNQLSSGVASQGKQQEGVVGEVDQWVAQLLEKQQEADHQAQKNFVQQQLMQKAKGNGSREQRSW